MAKPKAPAKKTSAKAKVKPRPKAKVKTKSRSQPPRKKRFVERPDLRPILLDAAERIIREDGYAAATARAIASKVGLKHQVIFYYFGSQDDLLLAVYRRAADAHRERLTEALNSTRPIRAIWEALSDRRGMRLALEFMALANHNDAIRRAIAQHVETVRRLETEAVSKHLEARGVKPQFSPEMVSILTNALARFLMQEEALGITSGHAEAEALVEGSLRRFEVTGETIGYMLPLVSALSGRD